MHPHERVLARLTRAGVAPSVNDRLHPYQRNLLQHLSEATAEIQVRAGAPPIAVNLSARRCVCCMRPLMG